MKLRNPPQTVSTMVAAVAAVADQARSRRQRPRGQRRQPELAGLRHRVGDPFPIRRRRQERRPCSWNWRPPTIAHLDALKATAALAQLNYDRDRTLVRPTPSHSRPPTPIATLKNDKAQVAQQQALVDYKSIRAPFSGRLGIRQVDLGQYLAAGTPIVTLQQLDPIFVDFYLPQQSLAQDQGRAAVTAKVDTYPDGHFNGKILAINSLVDTATPQRAGARDVQQSR